MRLTTALVLAVFALAAPASAQILPPLQVPNVGDVVQDVRNTTRDTVRDVDLRQVRELAARDLLRQHRQQLEADPQGFPIVRSQIIALSPSPAALETAVAAGFQIVARDEFGELGAMVTLRAPAGMSTRRALQRLREADPPGAYDFDHLHFESGPASDATIPHQSRSAANGPRIGLIDSGVDGAVAAQRAFASSSPVAAAHGRTVAGLLRSAAPGAQLYVADIYGGAPTGGASSALARALNWLAAERTPVINISLVGPRNRVIETLIAQLVSRGFIIVAAVGNDGPAAAPLFPASYPGVVGVTGVDARQRVLIEAGRGQQVDFAALGIVSERVRGTSYAAPIVAGRLATELHAPNAQRANAAIATLTASARDLGARGRDNVYGAGLIETERNLATR